MECNVTDIELDRNHYHAVKVCVASFECQLLYAKVRAISSKTISQQFYAPCPKTLGEIAFLPLAIGSVGCCSFFVHHKVSGSHNSRKI